MRNDISSERVDLFEPNIYIQFFVQIAGNPPVDELLAAVKSAFAANEATMSKIVLRQDGTAFYEKMETSGCRVTVTEKEWLTLIRENEKRPFRIDEGEFVRVFINPFGSETSLFIMAHHLVGDGKSITYFLEDVMRALSGEAFVYKPLHLITEESFPPEARLPLFYKLYANRFNRKWRRTGRSFGWEDYDRVHEAYWKERSSNVLYESFSPEEVGKIGMIAREMGVSLNSFLTTAFLRANPKNRCIGIAVDARTGNRGGKSDERSARGGGASEKPRDNGDRGAGGCNRAMSNQATGISVDDSYSEKRSFAENAGIVHKKIQQKLNRPVMRYFILQFIPQFAPTLIDSILLYTYHLYENAVSGKLAKVMGYAGGKTRELGITNLTRLDIPDVYGKYELKEALFIPPVVSYAKHIVGVVSMEDGMRISYHYMSDQSDAMEREFFKRAVEHIRHACEPAEL